MRGRSWTLFSDVDASLDKLSSVLVGTNRGRGAGSDRRDCLGDVTVRQRDDEMALEPGEVRVVLKYQHYMLNIQHSVARVKSLFAFLRGAATRATRWRARPPPARRR